jgi:hypothetical protein
MGAWRPQPVATGSKCEAAENGEINPKPLPWVSDRLRPERMVMSGSTQRRQIPRAWSPLCASRRRTCFHIPRQLGRDRFEVPIERRCRLAR